MIRDLRGSGFANGPLPAMTEYTLDSGAIGRPACIAAPSMTDANVLLAERRSCVWSRSKPKKYSS